MPFTPAHAVVALPLLRTPLIPAAIAIGSMTPDVPLFVRVGIDYWFTHSWPGVLLADLPLALALTMLWWLVLRGAVPTLVPQWIAERLPKSWTAPVPWRRIVTPRSTLLLLASLLIGIVSHLLWDEVTHAGRWGSAVLPQFDALLGPVTIWDWLHYASSVAGLVILAVWMTRWLRRRTPVPVDRALPARMVVLLWMLVPVALVAGVLIVLATRGAPTDPGAVVDLVARGGTLGGALILAGFGAVSVVVQVRLRARHARDAP